MKNKQVCDILKHGNTYVDVKFCPECGHEGNKRIDGGTYTEEKGLLEYHYEGSTYECTECHCEYMVGEKTETRCRKFDGFLGRLFFTTAIVSGILSVVLGGCIIGRFFDTVNKYLSHPMSFYIIFEIITLLVCTSCISLSDPHDL